MPIPPRSGSISRDGLGSRCVRVTEETNIDCKWSHESVSGSYRQWGRGAFSYLIIFSGLSEIVS